MCARCHGVDGRGDPEIKKTLPVRDFSDPQFQARTSADQIGQDHHDGEEPDAGLRGHAVRPEDPGDVRLRAPPRSNAYQTGALKGFPDPPASTRSPVEVCGSRRALAQKPGDRTESRRVLGDNAAASRAPAHRLGVDLHFCRHAGAASAVCRARGDDAAEARRHAQRASSLAASGKCRQAVAEWTKALAILRDPALLFKTAPSVIASLETPTPRWRTTGSS